MKATVKKFLRCTFPILLVSLMLAVFCVSAFAEEATPGDSWWSLDMETGILYVEGDVPESCNWLGYYPPWYEWKDVITEVRISEGAEYIGAYGFAGCSKLVKVILPNSLKNIEEYAFGDCNSLKELRIPRNVSFVDSNAFSGSYSLERLLVDPNNPYYTSDAQGILYKKDMTELVLCPKGITGTITIPHGVTTLAGSCFAWCEMLTEVSFPDSVTEIRACAFEYCTELVRIKLPGSVTMVESCAFQGCSALKTADIAKADMKEPDAVFSGCDQLEKVTVSRDNPYFTCDGQGAIYDKTMDRILLCPEGFAGNFIIPNGVKRIEESAFSSCGKLTEVEIPYSVTEIGEDAFFYCTSLKKLVIPNSVKVMGNPVFAECRNLVSVVLPASFAVIDEATLDGCYDLEELYFRGPAPDIDGWIYLSYAATLYYVEGQEGWTTPIWENRTTKTWSGFVATDVKESDYFYEAVEWALEKEITTGVGNDLFRPENTCTRGQVVTFLWRAKGCPEPTTTENPFEDISPKDYYYKAVLWAAEQGITTGVTKNRFAPEKGCTRAQVVTFLWRAESKPQITPAQNPFQDVEENTYYADAVAWAVKQGITTGKTKDNFAPEDLCTRGQIVTFLYRARDFFPHAYGPYYPVLQSLIEKQDHSNPGQGIFYDLDGNGVDEMIYLYTAPDGSDTYCAVYTVEDGEAVALLENHSFAYLVGGNAAALALTEIEGQSYLCTYARYYDRGHSEEYEYIDYTIYVWELFQLTDKGLILTDEYKYNCTEGYNGEEWVLISEKSSFTVNDEERPLQEFYTWRDSIQILGILDGRSNGDQYDCGYTGAELLSLCKP